METITTLTNLAKHNPTYTIRPDNEIQCDCACGAMWVHPAGTKEEKLKSIHESHLRYFNKPKMETL
jgi:hypothetical protein